MLTYCNDNFGANHRTTLVGLERGAHWVISVRVERGWYYKGIHATYALCPIADKV